MFTKKEREPSESHLEPVVAESKHYDHFPVSRSPKHVVVPPGDPVSTAGFAFTPDFENIIPTQTS
jgi:hypothetical protein